MIKTVLYFLIISILCSTFLLMSNQAVDLMISNNAQDEFLIQNCFLNGYLVPNCKYAIQPHQNIFFDPKKTKYPKTNRFSINLKIENESKQYFCFFEKVSRSCIEEISINEKGIFCSPLCSDIY